MPRITHPNALAALLGLLFVPLLLPLSCRGESAIQVSLPPPVASPSALASAGADGGAGRDLPPLEEDEHHTPPDLDASADAQVDAGQGQVSGVIVPPGNQKNCPALRWPSGIPTSWKQSDEWTCDCRLYYAPQGEDVTPFSWEPCDLSKQPWAEGWACKQMAFNFPTRKEYQFIHGITWDFSDTNKPPRMAVKRTSLTPEGNDLHTIVVSTPDGPPEFALAVSPNWKELSSMGRCALLPRTEISIKGGKFFALVLGDGHSDKTHGVIWRNEINQARVIYRGSQFIVPSIRNGYGQTFVEYGKGYSIDIKTGQPTEIYNGFPSFTPFEGGAFLELHLAQSTRQIMTWTKEQGVKPFLADTQYWKHGYGGFGTDGKDLVWTDEDNLTNPVGPNDYHGYSNRSLMTAPFTTDPSKLKPRRLRSDPLHEEPVVGCGYAAKAYTEYGASRVLVVRLSDGVSWTLKAPPQTEAGDDYRFIGETVGISCDEVFFEASHKTEWTVWRVRLDSLGPGTPPD